MIVSSIKGRIRFRDENIKNPSVEEMIKNRLKNLDGIEYIRINDLIGSLLINYDIEKISLTEITDLLKEYIDTSLELQNSSNQNSNYIDGAVEVFKRGMKGKSKGQGQGQGKNKQSSNDGNDLAGLVIENITGNKAVKGLLYSFLGVQGYKKGKGLMQGKGKKG